MTTTNTISRQTIHDETLWVAKMCGYRTAGTYAEVGYLFYDEDCRDFDTVCAEGQPESVRPFWEAYEAYANEHGFVLVDDFYRNVYAVEALKADPSLGEYVETETPAMRRARKEAEERETVYTACGLAQQDLTEEGVECDVRPNWDWGTDATVFVPEGTDEELVHDVMRDYGFFFHHSTQREGVDIKRLCYVCVA